MEQIKLVMDTYLKSMEQQRIDISDFDKEQILLQDQKEYQKLIEDCNRSLERESAKSLRIPSRFLDATLQNWIPRDESEKEILKRVCDFAKFPNDKVLLLYGKFGTGKTHLACAVAKIFKGYYMTFEDICERYSESANFHSEQTQHQVFESFCTAKILIIDEILKTSRTKDGSGLLARIIRRRYDEQLPTVLCTNLSKREIVEFLGGAVYDRMKGACISCEFNGTSHRTILRKNNSF